MYLFRGISADDGQTPYLNGRLQGRLSCHKTSLDCGHRKILGIFKADDFQGKERHKGYVKALQESGLSYDPDMVVWFHTEDRKMKPAR